MGKIDVRGNAVQPLPGDFFPFPDIGLELFLLITLALRLAVTTRANFELWSSRRRMGAKILVALTAFNSAVGVNLMIEF
ncbi:MAG: hypothetical protein A2W03_10095 [Candidatus Aminicenantes bacterium RBG_16_63_16]|nr:MAG: hypothetical protein A2W03_10095 [Candidatus Aminicenantes bacterium RBG_16_63_16]